MSRGFTLIELLVVVGVIAILAAMALPNFLNAQTRARVARVRADMRTLDTALNAYAVDERRYPLLRGTFTQTAVERLVPLTTPVAYLTTLPVDPFRHDSDYSNPTLSSYEPDVYLYNTGAAMFGVGTSNPYSSAQMRWSLTSAGPDNKLEYPYYAFAENFMIADRYLVYIYDPTNGTTSRGEIFRTGGNVAKPLPGLVQ